MPRRKQSQSQSPRSIFRLWPVLPKKNRKRAPKTFGTERAGQLYARLAEDRPDPHTELNFVNPYTLVVAVALSAQATDVGVNKATKALFEIADTPEKMIALGELGVAEHIKTIGLWRNKAKNVIALSRMLIDDFDSIVPEKREELIKLPGVGRKTANVVQSMAFGIPTMAVDTHVFRIGNRLGLAPGKTPDDVEDILMKRIPQEYLYHAHHWLILHGRYCCKAKKPECEKCVIADICKSKEKTCDISAPVVELPPQII